MRANDGAVKGLPSASRTFQGIEAHLIEYSQDPAKQNRVWTFFYNPPVMRFTRQANFSPAETFAANVQDRQYSHTDGKTLSIEGLVMDSYCMGKSLKPLLDGLESLLQARLPPRQVKPTQPAKPTDAEKAKAATPDKKTATNNEAQKPDPPPQVGATGQFAPPLLVFIWGSRRFGPCILERVNWEETAWLGGEPAKATLGITLIEVPKPETREGKTGTGKEAAQDFGSKPKTDTTPKPNNEGKPRIALTDRQREDASNKAKEHLKANVASFDPAVQAVIKANAYKLSTDKDSGDVKLLDGKGKDLGIVGRWDGDKTFTTEGVSTIPAKDKAVATSSTSATTGGM